jgi:hypothetical protein
MERLMALWRDPLDELIEALDHGGIAADPGARMPSFTEVQRVVQIILHGTDEDRSRIENDPVVLYMRRVAGFKASAEAPYVLGERSEPTESNRGTNDHTLDESLPSGSVRER